MREGKEMPSRAAERLCSFIGQSPTAYQAIAAMRPMLEGAGFAYVGESEPWPAAPGSCLYTVRNGSSLVAVRVGRKAENPAFRVVASHADSPSFKVKASAELEGPGAYVRLNVDPYGGAIDRTWLDRPLSVAGRVMVREGDHIRMRLLNIDRDVLLIPSLPIHLNRDVNKEGALDRHVDMVPLFSADAPGQGSFTAMIARELGVSPDDVLGHDLYLANRQRPIVWGEAGEFISAPRLDDLQCAYATLAGFTRVADVDEHDIHVYVCFDNEEVGSGTMQGAQSTLLSEVLHRTCDALGLPSDAYERAVARSLMLSCDNAHAVHPNHPELFDATNRAWINRGIVVKESANQRYTTDAVGRALFVELCRRAGVPTQRFANRSDLLGGSTLGNLATRHVSMHVADIGLPQLAMHSAYETAGTRDTTYLEQATREFFSCPFTIADDEIYLPRT